MSGDDYDAPKPDVDGRLDAGQYAAALERDGFLIAVTAEADSVGPSRLRDLIEHFAAAAAADYRMRADLESRR